MAIIFLSYRRTDSPEACRVYDWLGQRLGYDSIFMDVAAIPFAVQFPDFIKQEIAKSRVLIALIGNEWAKRIHEANDSVRMEIEAAVANQIPVLPLLIGNTPMVDAELLPASISAIASQNAVTVGVSLDFHSHMQSLLPKIETILGNIATTGLGSTDPDLFERACRGIIDYLRTSAVQSMSVQGSMAQWRVIGVDGFINRSANLETTLYLHRVRRLAELIELHFILSFWAGDSGSEQLLAGWTFRHLGQNPVVPDQYLTPLGWEPEFILKIRWSDEDPRQVWKMITDQPLRFSLAYVATVSPKLTPATPLPINKAEV
jgi:hypothetical protein